MSPMDLTNALLAQFREECSGLVFSEEWTEIDAFREWWHDLGEAVENALGN